MPLYEYECAKCHRVTEKIEKVTGPHLKKCPHCGGKVEQKVSRSAIQFKGSGWYITDYAGKKAAADATDGNSGTTDKSDSKDTSTKESGTKETKDSKDPKPATATEKKAEKKKS